MKLGILGGSFNPIHLGHLFIADKAITALKLDRLVMVPAFRSPFKLNESNIMESGENRINMLAAAVAGDSRIAVDDCELRREGLSYTIDTLEDIIERYLPEGKPCLIIGDDLAGEFLSWRNSARILELAEIVIVRRLNSARSSEEIAYPHTLIDCTVMDISSHDVRRKIAEGSDWRSLVPSAARVIIEDRKLYLTGDVPAGGKNKDCSAELIMRLETAARQTLNTARFLHARNTALLARDMCLRFGLDPAAGYLAGIAHDLGKQLDSKELTGLVKSDGLGLCALEKDKPNLLHGRAAAVLLRERFCIHNKDILEAVAFHTSGSENMGVLAKVIYIADKVEVSRNIDSSLRKMCYEEDSLDNIFYTVLKKTVSKLQSRELTLSDSTLKLLEKMKERKI